MGRQRYRESDPVEEILTIAVKNQGGTDVSLRERLLASAAELGISEEAVLEAERQWQAQKAQEQELAAYRADTLRHLWTHLGVYLVINFFLCWLNMLTSHGRLDWAPYVIVSWGIGMGAHLVTALIQLKNPGGEELKNWRNDEDRQHGLTIGVRLPHRPSETRSRHEQ
jgi:hypothetical protein